MEGLSELIGTQATRGEEKKEGELEDNREETISGTNKMLKDQGKNLQKEKGMIDTTDKRDTSRERKSTGEGTDSTEERRDTEVGTTAEMKMRVIERSSTTYEYQNSIKFLYYRRTEVRSSSSSVRCLFLSFSLE